MYEFAWKIFAVVIMIPCFFMAWVAGVVVEAVTEGYHSGRRSL